MKALFFLVSIVVFSVVNAQSQTLFKTNFSSIFIPAGFDSNDRIQLVGKGMFPNSCYKSAATEVKIDRVAKTIKLIATANKYDGLCLQMLVPYNEPVDIGVLEAGSYKIISGLNKRELGVLPVAGSLTRNADDYLYAPVSQAFFEPVVGSETGEAKVILTGEFTNSCMKVSEVKVSIEPKVLVILPISEALATNELEGCRTGKFPFRKEVMVNGLKAGSYLLHIRALNATAVNQVVEVY